MADTTSGIHSQHAEEAAFLWLLRDAAVAAPHYTLVDLAGLDQRVEAHLDGLRVAGSDGLEVAQTELEKGEPGEVFVAALLGFEVGDADGIKTILTLAAAVPELARAVVSALGWLGADQAQGHIKTLLANPLPAVRRIGIAVAAVDRLVPREAIAAALGSQDVPLRCRALKAVGELGLGEFLPMMRGDLMAEDETVRCWAAWSCALLAEDKQAISTLQEAVVSLSRMASKAIEVVVRRMEISAAAGWVRKLAGDPQNHRSAIVAVGILGIPDSISWLIERMATPALARVAGEAFSMITGTHIAYDKLEAEPPEGFEAGPSENPDDDDVAMDADENLPWPDAARIQAWWNKHGSEFSPGTRYLAGKPITPEWLNELLRTGRQRQRAAAALELAILQPGKPLFNVRAPGFRQQQWLSGK